MKTTLQIHIKTLILLTLGLIITQTQTLFAQENSVDEAISEENKIALRVARLSYIEGTVTVLRYTGDDWTEGELNMPLMAGDKIFADAGSRAEIQLDDQTTVRIGSDTFVSFPFLDDAVGRIDVVKGQVNVHAADVDYVRPPFEITTKNILAVILNHAAVRLDVQGNGDTELAVRRGDINIQEQGDDLHRLVRGEKLIALDPDPKKYTTVKFNDEDTFDQWSDVREAMIAARTNDPYVTPRISGVDELARYGDWVQTPNYGRVWRPRVIATDWAPYRDGRWAWREPYGWIWVSNEPWGWVPYHYGRWVHVNDYDWVWVPRDTVVVRTYKNYHRPVWYPALVSFSYASHGRHFSLSVSSGYYHRPVVGWFPLGVSDPYDPWYDYNRVYVNHRHHDYYPRRSFHISYGYSPHYNHNRYHHRYNYHDGFHFSGHHDNHVYQNIYVDNAVTIVSQDDFVSGDTSRRRRVTIDRNAEPSIQTGSRAVTTLSDRRITQTRAAAATHTNSITNPPLQDNSSRINQPRTEPRRNVESRETRTSPTNTGNWQAQNRRDTTTKAVRSPINTAVQNNTQPASQSTRNSVTQRPRSSERAGVSQAISPSINNTGTQSSSRIQSPARNPRPQSGLNSSSRDSNAPAQTSRQFTDRPRSSTNYIQKTYPNRTSTTRVLERPRNTKVVEPRQSRTSSSSRESTYAKQRSQSQNQSSAYTPPPSYQSNTRQFGRTVNVSESRDRSTSSLPRVYSPERQSGSSRVEQNRQSYSIPSNRSNNAFQNSNSATYNAPRSAASSSPRNGYNSSPSSHTSSQRNSVSVRQPSSSRSASQPSYNNDSRSNSIGRSNSPSRNYNSSFNRSSAIQKSPSGSRSIGSSLNGSYSGSSASTNRSSVFSSPSRSSGRSASMSPSRSSAPRSSASRAPSSSRSSSTSSTRSPR